MRVISTFLIGIIMACASALALPQTVSAAVQPMTVTLCLPGTFGAACNPDAASGNIDGYIQNLFLQPVGAGGPRMVSIFASLLFFMLVLYGLKLAVSNQQDGAMSEAIQAYTQAAIGAGVVGGAFLLSTAFSATPAVVADTTVVKDSILLSAARFLFGTVIFVVTANIVIQGIRMIIAVNEGNVESARKNFIQSLIGGAMVMIVGPIFNSFSGLGAGGGGTVQTLVVQIANFLGVIFGVLAVIAFIVAGIMLVVSVNESLRDRARSLMISSIIAIIVVVAALAIVSFLL